MSRAAQSLATEREVRRAGARPTGNSERERSNALTVLGVRVVVGSADCAGQWEAWQRAEPPSLDQHRRSGMEKASALSGLLMDAEMRVKKRLSSDE